MSFFVAQKTLERLEWPQLVAALAEHARTPGGRERCLDEGRSGESSLFESTRSGVLERQAETAEARAILAAGDLPPLGGIAAIDGALRRARKDGLLEAAELLDLAATLAASRLTRRFFDARRDSAARLADLADGLVEHRPLEQAIEAALEPSGLVRDDASPALAEARRDSRRFASQIQSSIGQTLRDPNIAAHLSDSYYTIRNDRYVLPVRTDARGSVRGIVHDASGSGMTLFIEPEALVDLNNQLKRAEIAIEQETLRVLRELSRHAAAVVDEIEANLATLEVIDLAVARGALAESLDAVAPEVGDAGHLHLPGLRHPLIPTDQVVASDVALGESFCVLVLSGPNAGGKTVTLKAIALAALCVRAGLHVTAGEGARVDLFDAVLADIGDEQDIRENLSTFSAHLANLADIRRRASSRALVVLDEVGVGTDPGEGAALAQAFLESLADDGARVVTTTHYNLLKEIAEVDGRFANACVEFDPETLLPTYRVCMGLPGASSATAVAERMGLDAAVIARARELLAREDRQLDRVLAELTNSRAALEAEQRDIARVRIETESLRDEHRRKLERLQERRDKLFAEMRSELEQSFRSAHENVAAVIRNLQRGGTARHAARARAELQSIQARAHDTQREAGLHPTEEDAPSAIDWSTAAVGDPVRIADGGPAVLLALPDRRGRVAVRLGSARVLVPKERLRASTEAPTKKRPAAIQVTAAPEEAEPDDGPARCDLRGLRVDEALDVLIEALDRATSDDRAMLTIVHGIGTGALRQAVREHLRASAYVRKFATASPNEGGDGVTIATLR